MPDSPLHLVTIDLDTGALIRRGRQRGLPLHTLDGGYLVHSWLETTFGPKVLRPFALEGEHGAVVRVLAYAPRSAAELSEEAERYAPASDYAAAHWATFESKPMPKVWKVDELVGFRVTVIPTVRPSRPEENAGHQEVDAYLARVRAHLGPAWTEAPPPAGESGEGLPFTREQVYGAWLESRFAERGAKLEGTARLTRFHLADLLRRTQGETRKGRRVRLPEACLEGEFRVTDPVAFQSLLVDGVGRHKAFGYGMVLLRRPERFR
jgi:CRISPR system Cascade subunit CasE